MRESQFRVIAARTAKELETKLNEWRAGLKGFRMRRTQLAIDSSEIVALIDYEAEGPSVAEEVAKLLKDDQPIAWKNVPPGLTKEKCPKCETFHLLKEGRAVNQVSWVRVGQAG